MKKSAISSFLMGILLAGGCSESVVDPENNSGAGSDGRVPITLGVSMQGVASSRAIVNEGSVTAGIAGWEFPKAVAQESYAGTATWGADAGSAVSIRFNANATAQSVTWDPQQYYNADPLTYTHMRAWYPAGTYKAGGKVEVKNENAQEDFLIAPLVIANKNTAQKDCVFQFEHATALLKFKIIKSSTYTGNGTLTSLKIKNVDVPDGFDFSKETGRLTKTNTDVSVISTETQLSDKGTEPDRYFAMIAPSASETLTLSAVIDGVTYDKIQVAISNAEVDGHKEETGLLRGVAYEITLTLTKKGIAGQASVAAWKTGGTGTGEIS